MQGGWKLPTPVKYQSPYRPGKLKVRVIVAIELTTPAGDINTEFILVP